MIRINLLPVRVAKKKESLRFQLTMAGLITVLVIVICLAVYVKLRIDSSILNQDIASKESELTELRKKVGELGKLQEEKRMVQGKLDVVDRLEKGRTGPTELFEKISGAIPEKAWLKLLNDQATTITITGSAATDEVVADFMRNLERAELGRVELQVLTRSPQKQGLELVDFTILVMRK